MCNVAHKTINLFGTKKQQKSRVYGNVQSLRLFALNLCFNTKAGGLRAEPNGEMQRFLLSTSLKIVLLLVHICSLTALNVKRRRD